jgi:predicted nucleotide-binding protein
MHPLVYLLEDDKFLAATLAEELRDIGCKVEILPDAATVGAKKGRAPTMVISDLFVPAGALSRRSSNSRHAGHGLEALRKARAKWKRAKLVLITGLPSLDAQKWCADNGATYLVKPVERQTFERLLGLRRIRAFVVHGRDSKARDKAIAALEKANIEAVVLMLQPNRGRTVIEKFEAVADTCDAAVVVWSPDDFGGLASAPAGTAARSRARQNVVLELGYFYGALRRRSGRVVILECGDTELPSDLAGVVRIDATRRLATVVADLRAEFEDLL